jgi:rubrerythrin
MEFNDRRANKSNAGWPTAKCGHIVETKKSPCPACDKEAYLTYVQKSFDKKGK